MKKIKQTCYFNPSVAFFIEDEATKNKTTFNHELNKYIEKKLAEEENESKILAEVRDLRDVQTSILELLDTVVRDIK